jgi:myogenesis-regulating glycosidase
MAITRILSQTNHIGTVLISAILTAALFTLNVFSQTVSLGETDGTVNISTERYDVEFQKHPFQITVNREGTDIFRTGHYEGVFFQRGGKTYPIDRITSHILNGNELHISALTGLENIPVTLNVSFFDRYFHLSLETTGEERNERTGINIKLTPGGHWYGGNVTSAHIWPLETGNSGFDPFYATSNQTSPIWLTSSGMGVFVNSYDEMGFDINRDNSGMFSLFINDQSALNVTIIVGENIVDAYFTMIQLIGLPEQVPPKEFFTKPIFNTWIEFFTEVHQDGVVEYARTMRSREFPYSILMIDDGWATAYGDFEFDKSKFPDPAGMIAELDSLGFKVALWITPFVEHASENFLFAQERAFLILDETGEGPYITRWWNGDAGLIDFSNPDAYNWYVNELNGLIKRYNIAGFKLDGGDAEYLSQPYRSFGSITPNEYTDLFASVGSYFAVNEFRVSWLTQSRGLVQRLRDKGPNWSKEDGLNSLIPHGLTIGLIGYPFFCPDMIGGGLDGGFRNEEFMGMDPELFIRWTQASALMPMMQFSYAPWHLDERSLEIVKKYVDLHTDLGDYIYELALEAGREGTPIVRPLFFRNPEDPDTYTIPDQFMLGEKYLVAPVLTKGALSRDIYLPEGTWRDYWTGAVYRGKTKLTEFPAPIDLLPVFISGD